MPFAFVAVVALLCAATTLSLAFDFAAIIVFVAVVVVVVPTTLVALCTKFCC